MIQNRLSLLVLLFVVSFLGAGCNVFFSADTEEKGTVVSVADGDTITVKLNGVKQRVRLIGIDAPELAHEKQSEECYALESTAELKELVLEKEVLLEADSTQDNADQYGRLLRYVFLADEATVSVNQKLVADGFAFEYTYDDPYRYQREFRDAEGEADQEGNGLWAKDTCDGQKKKP